MKIDKIIYITISKEEWNNEVEYILYGVSESGKVYRGTKNWQHENEIYWELVVKSPKL